MPDCSQNSCEDCQKSPAISNKFCRTALDGKDLTQLGFYLESTQHEAKVANGMASPHRDIFGVPFVKIWQRTGNRENVANAPLNYSEVRIASKIMHDQDCRVVDHLECA